MKSRMKVTRNRWVILLGLGLLLGPVTVQARHKMLSDAMIRTLVDHQLIKHDLQREDNIQVSVDDHVVTLEGTVRSLAEKKRAQRRAAKVEDVSSVENHLVIEVPDRTDRQIAADVVRSIRSFVFFDIFDWLEGEVNNGMVNLKGWVREP